MSAGAPSKELVDAYLDTDFAVFGPFPQVFRIGQDDGAAAAWLMRVEATSATIATAWNPFSQRQSDEENMSSQDRFRLELEARGFRHCGAEGRARSGAWPAEPSLCIFDATDAQADEWLVDHRQNAVVRIHADGKCLLVWHPALREACAP